LAGFLLPFNVGMAWGGAKPLPLQCPDSCIFLKDLAMLRQISILTLSLLLPLPAWSTPNIVEMQTNLGTITFKLDPVKAPLTVANFLSYIDDGFYNQTLFHTVTKTADRVFTIQGGGIDLATMQYKAPKDPIANEAKTSGLSNLKGTISMERSGSPPYSVTSKFFINYGDNLSLDYRPKQDGPPTVAENPGHPVFGEVIEGMDVVNKIAQLDTLGRYSLVPSLPRTSDYDLVYIEKVYVSEDMDLVNVHTRVTVTNGGKVIGLPGGINCSASGGSCESSKPSSSSKYQILIAKPDSKFVFSGWSGDCVGTKTNVSLPLTRNHNCKALFSAAVAQK